MNEILSIFQNASPIGVIALLVAIIFYMVRNERRMGSYQKLATNHTSGLPEMIKTLDRIDATMIRIEGEMGRQTNMLTRIDTKLNGK